MDMPFRLFIYIFLVASFSHKAMGDETCYGGDKKRLHKIECGGAPILVFILDHNEEGAIEEIAEAFKGRSQKKKTASELRQILNDYKKDVAGLEQAQTDLIDLFKNNHLKWWAIEASQKEYQQNGGVSKYVEDYQTYKSEFLKLGLKDQEVGQLLTLGFGIDVRVLANAPETMKKISFEPVDDSISKEQSWALWDRTRTLKKELRSDKKILSPTKLDKVFSAHEE